MEEPICRSRVRVTHGILMRIADTPRLINIPGNKAHSTIFRDSFANGEMAIIARSSSAFPSNSRDAYDAVLAQTIITNSHHHQLNLRVNPSNTEATSVQRTRTQRFSKTI